MMETLELAEVVDVLGDRLDGRKVRLAVTGEPTTFTADNMDPDVRNYMASFFQEDPTRLNQMYSDARHVKLFDLTDTVTKRLKGIKFDKAAHTWDVNFVGGKGSGKSIAMLFMCYWTQVKLWEQPYDSSTFYLNEMQFCIDSRWKRDHVYKNNFVCIDEQGMAMREIGEGSQHMHMRFMAERQLFRPYRSPIFQCSTDWVNTSPHHVAHVLGVDFDTNVALVAETSPDSQVFLGYFFTGLPEQHVMDDYEARREKLKEYMGSQKWEYWTPFIDKLVREQGIGAETKVTDKLVEVWCAELGEKVGKGEATFLKTMIMDRVKPEDGHNVKKSEQVKLSDTEDLDA